MQIHQNIDLMGRNQPCRIFIVEVMDWNVMVHRFAHACVHRAAVGRAPAEAEYFNARTVMQLKKFDSDERDWMKIEVR